MKPIVFLGPTLTAEEARPELDATYLPPVTQGDVYRAALVGPPTIGIVDGYFHHVGAVWHKEILWAMARGVHVFGSASMGALRAAELAPFGMEGTGWIFERFRSGDIEDDDEVAVAHCSGDDGERPFAPISEAMVNIRRTLASATEAGVIRDGTHQELLAIAKSWFYADRTYPALLRAGCSGANRCELDGLASWLPQGRIDQKRTDAVDMLRTMKARLEERAVAEGRRFRLRAHGQLQASDQRRPWRRRRHRRDDRA